MELPSVAAAKRTAAAFSAFIMRLPPGSNSFMQLTKPRPIKAGQQGHDQEGQEAVMPIVDMTVYSRNQCFRMLYSSKAGKPSSLLRPVLGSSSSIGAHLVRVYPPDSWAEAMQQGLLDTSPLSCHIPASSLLNANFMQAT